MNKIGIHALVWAGELDPQGARTVVENSRAAGYDFVEFSLHNPGVIDIDLTRSLLRDNGLGVACSRGLAIDADVSSEDPATVARGVALLEEAVSITAALGGTYFGGVPYSAFRKYDHPVTPKGRTHIVGALKHLAKVAGDKGVTIGIEVVNRYESNVVNTARQALALIDEIGASNLTVHLDSYHMNIEERDFFDPIATCGSRLGYMHIGESHRGYLGSGTIDFRSLFHALAAVDYQGPIAFESFSSAVVAEGLSNDLAVWRNLWDDGMDLARHAHGFITAQAKGAGLGAGRVAADRSR